ANIEHAFSEDAPLLHHLTRTLVDMSRSSRAFRSLSETLEQQPEALLRGRSVKAEEKKTMRYPIVLLVVCSLLGACQSSPRKNFYLLTAEPVAAPSSTTIDTLIGVGPIEVAEYLNRLHMVYEVKDGSLVVADNAHWAEPLNEGI